ncbi:hypothetical protein GJ744_010183 [Endocarpon pusillum]|uniref:Uncharacterized protein n=1 Tax=Endocarpon pusillum TaxID=364733 RepID=A0A8H7AHY7_9EURO|nr:hypothetical protein GJ744_010183 [Endocarpon pusillum]
MRIDPRLRWQFLPDPGGGIQTRVQAYRPRFSHESSVVHDGPMDYCEGSGGFMSVTKLYPSAWSAW